ncbi:hypothetical protein B9Z55_010322 [Caenorhabditis nigoni]|uniref:Serpentine receptor class gamma n=1 Tax=Caenorhabditis nigoni TaxID=1611254 RepID=A0A2G5UFC6_9PELO|nr:hypothetical protein B9Z55_010322 [Caenorhabditis nigoni]
MSFDNLFNYAYVFVIVSYIYMFLTVGVVWKMYKVYYANHMILKSIVVHRCLFQTFIWMQIAICKKLFLVFIPITLITPIIADFYMIPAPGACRRLKPPYPPGAISISYGQSLFNIRTDNFMLGLTFFAPVAILFMNAMVVGIIRPEFVPYAQLIRNRIIDFGMISVPWIFYFSHPMFHDKTARVSSMT